MEIIPFAFRWIIIIWMEMAVSLLLPLFYVVFDPSFVAFDVCEPVNYVSI